MGTPLLLSYAFNRAAPGANTNIFSGVEARTCPSDGILLITFNLATASVVNLIDSDGTTAMVIGLERSTTQSAGDGFAYSWIAKRGHQYNLQVETDGIIRQAALMLDPSGAAG